MDTLTLRQFKALSQLKVRLLLRFWAQRGQTYRLSLFVSMAFSILFACGLGVGIGFLIYVPMPSGPGLEILPELMQFLWMGVFLAVSVIWLVSPIMLMMKNESLSLDISRLTRFPISYRTLHSFHSLLALIEPWTLFFYPVGLGLLVGVVARGGWVSLGPGLILVLLWLLVHTVWSRFVQDLMAVLFTSRYLREFLSLGIILLLIMLAFIPAMVSESSSLQQLEKMNAPNLEVFLYQWPVWHKLQVLLNALLFSTPAGWFAHALSGLFQQDWRAFIEGCVALFAWMSLANVLDIVLLRRLFSEPPAQVTARRQSDRRLRGGFLQSILPHDIRTLVLKELRTYFRSILGKLSFFLTPLLVTVLRLVGLGASGHVPPASLLLGMTLYIFMTSLFLYINFFGSDHEGFKIYVLAGVSERRLLLAKNLALSLFSGAEFAIVLVLFVLLYRQLDLQTLWFGLCSFVSLLLGVLSMGNILSLRFPAAMDLNQTQYRQSNGTPILLGLQILTVLGVLVACPIWLAYLFREPLWLLSTVLTAMLAFAWWLILPLAEAIFRENRLQILEAVTRDD